MSKTNHYILTWQCPDTSGVLAKVTQSLFDHGAFITETCQYSDPYTEIFFSRIAFDDRNLTVSIEEFSDAIKELAQPLNMQFQLRERDHFPNIVIAVSKDDHCLVSLLTKWKADVLPVNIVAIVSNHKDCQPLAKWHGIPFHYLPVSKANKAEQEAAMLAIMEDTRADLLVLARYMQILSDDMCCKLRGHAINIHHSFLPAFMGGKPYHRAHERGVKLIGATAHYATADLDEGPIIEQDVERITHESTPKTLKGIGADIERLVLAKAVKCHLQHQIIVSDNRAIVFPESGE